VLSEIPRKGPAKQARSFGRLGLGLAWTVLASCSFDAETPAPYLAAPSAAGICGSTESLLPKLFDFVREHELDPLRAVIEARLLPTAERPAPDPSLRGLLDALVRLATGLGLERTLNAAEIASRNQTLQQLKPLLLLILRYVHGDVDGHPHFEAAGAGSTLFRTCDADNLLTAGEAVLRLPSQADPQVRWLAALSKDLAALIEEPSLTPFLETFRQDAQMGRPAILSLLNQIALFLTDETFDISRVKTLLESAVYPAVSNALRAKIEVLVGRLEEVTRPEVDVLRPLQRAIRCLNAQPETRAALFGLIYDLVTTPEVKLSELLATLDGLVTPERSSEVLDFVADLVKVLRQDRVAQKEILGFLAILFEEQNAKAVTPALLHAVEADLLGEVSDGIVRILGGCGRSLP